MAMKSLTIFVTQTGQISRSLGLSRFVQNLSSLEGSFCTFR
jgi:hypothetical protein